MGFEVSRYITVIILLFLFLFFEETKAGVVIKYSMLYNGK